MDGTLWETYSNTESYDEGHSDETTADLERSQLNENKIQHSSPTIFKPSTTLVRVVESHTSQSIVHTRHRLHNKDHSRTTHTNEPAVNTDPTRSERSTSNFNSESSSTDNHYGTQDEPSTTAESKTTTCIPEDEIEDYILAMDMRDDDWEYNDEHLPVEQRLMNHLLKDYERSVRPVKNASDTVLIKMGLTLTQIFDMVSLHNTLCDNLYSVMKRNDWLIVFETYLLFRAKLKLSVS